MKKNSKYNAVNLGLIIKMRRQELGFTQHQLASSIEMGRAAFNAIENGYSVAPLERIIDLNRVLGINLIDNDIILKSEDGVSTEEYNSLFNDKVVNHDLGKQIIQQSKSKNPKSRPILLPNGKSLLGIDLVESYNESDFLAQFSDKSRKLELDKYFISLDKSIKGDFLAWRINSRAMTSWTADSFPDKSIVIGSRIKSELWQCDYHMSQWKFFIVVLHTGIIVVEIVNTDTKNGVFEFQYLNPDKEYYPNFSANFEKCYAVYNIVCKIHYL